jgi:hypothetical protein
VTHTFLPNWLIAWFLITNVALIACLDCEGTLVCRSMKLLGIFFGLILLAQFVTEQWL